MPLPLPDSSLRPLCRRRPRRLCGLALLLALLTLPFVPSCKRSNSPAHKTFVYVSVPETVLRDRVAVVYNRVGTVKNGERLEMLEQRHRFARVRTAQNQVGWVALRCLAPAGVYKKFRQVAELYRDSPVQSHGVTRFAANMHVAPARDAATLYQLPRSTRVELLRRATSERATRQQVADARAAEIAKLAGETAPQEPTKASRPAPAAATHAAESKPGKPRVMDDWWVVRDEQGHTGWMLARLIYADIPLDVAQYAEGNRIQAAFVLNSVQDSVKGKVNEYLCLLNRNRDGIPYDFSQIRVFTWNLKRHRYETAYRRRHIMGYFPATVSIEDLGKQGKMPVFTVRLQNVDGSITARKYSLIGNVVRPVLAPGQSFPKAARTPDEGGKSLPRRQRRHHKGRARPWW